MTYVVGKLWGFCHTLRHDGIDYGDLTKKEKDELVTNCDRLQTLKHSSAFPRVFAEQAMAMLSAHKDLALKLGEFEPQQRRIPRLAVGGTAGLASESKNGSVPYGRRFAAAFSSKAEIPFRTELHEA